MRKSIKTILLFLITLGINSSSLIAQKSQIIKSQPNPIIIETIGQGKPILFLPGFTAPGSMWKETVENLTTKRESHLISYAGFNGNKPIEMPWYSQIRNSIIQYILDGNLSDIIIVGHSMGGNLAVDIAAELPERISKVVLVESLSCMRDLMMPNVSADDLVYDSPYNNQMLEMGELQFKEVATMMASNMTLDTYNKDIITDWILQADRKTWVYGYTDLLKLDLRSTLSKMKCETLIIGASFPDVNLAKENYENQYEKLSDKTIVMASNSKHFVMFYQPEWFYKTLNDFLDNGGR